MRHPEFIQTLAQIRITSGAKAKQLLLESCREHIEYLRLAYDPMINFYITSAKFKKDFIIGKDDELPHPTDFLLLTERKLTGNKAVDYVYETLNYRTKEVIDFVLMILDKDLHLGMKAKSINKVFKDLIFEYPIMLAERENREKFNLHFAKYEWIYLNEKIDGVRCVVEVTPTKCKFNSRTGKPLPDFLTENIEKDLIVNPIYHGKKFDGEIASKDFQGLMKIIQRKNVDFDSMLIRNSCKFYIFDLPEVPGTLEQRIEELNIIPETNFIKKLVYRKIKCDFALIKAIAKKFIDAGKEGIIIKKPDAPYEGKRSFSWMKFKGKESLDLKIVGYKPGEKGSKYENCLGSLILEYENGTVDCGSGFDDSDREYLWSIKESLPGKICQVSFMEKTQTDSLRHPVFETLRPDLD